VCVVIKTAAETVAQSTMTLQYHPHLPFINPTDDLTLNIVEELKINFIQFSMKMSEYLSSTNNAKSSIPVPSFQAGCDKINHTQKDFLFRFI
jgi:hypothetical protein